MFGSMPGLSSPGLLDPSLVAFMDAGVGGPGRVTVSGSPAARITIAGERGASVVLSGQASALVTITGVSE